MNRFFAFHPIILLSLFVLGCGDDSAAPTPDAGPAPDTGVPTPDAGPARDTGVPTPDTGPPGMTVASDDGVVTLTIADGALPAGVSLSDLRITRQSTPRAVELSVTRAEAEAGMFTAADRVPPVFAYLLEPEGTTFTTPVRATVRVAAGEIVDRFQLTLTSGDQIEALPIESSRLLADGGFEVDVLVPHFSELGAWSSGPPVGVALMGPRDGWTFLIGDAFRVWFDFTRLGAMTDRVRLVAADPRAGTPETLILESPLAGSMWFVDGDALGGFDGDPLTPAEVHFIGEEMPMRSPHSLLLPHFECAAEGTERVWAYGSWRVDGEVTRMIVVDGIPMGPGTTSGAFIRGSTFHAVTVHCGPPPPARMPCTSLMGNWTTTATFRQSDGVMYTDTLRLAINADGTAMTEQPSTGDIDTGHAGLEGEQCVVAVRRADGGERYHLNVFPLTPPRFVGINVYDDATSGELYSVVSGTLMPM